MKLSRQTLSVIVIAALFLCGVYSYHFIRPDIERASKQNDFAHYYCTALLTLESGSLPYGADLVPCYSRFNFVNVPEVATPTNPPGLISITLPLVLFSPGKAYILWQCLQLGMLVVTLVIAFRYFKFNIRSQIVITVWILLSHPLWTHLEYAQTQLMLLPLLLGGICLLDSENKLKNGAGALFFGVTAGIKMFTLPLIVPLFLTGGFRLIPFFITGVVLVHLPVFFITLTPDLFSPFFLNAYPYISRAAYAYSGITSIPGLSRLMLPVSPEAAVFTSYLLILLCTTAVILLWLKRKEEVRKGEFLKSVFLAEAIALCVFISPVAWVHYLVLLIVPLILLYRLLPSDNRTLFLLLILCVTGFCLQNGHGSTPAGAPGLSALLLIISPALLLYLTEVLGRAKSYEF